MLQGYASILNEKSNPLAQPLKMLPLMRLYLPQQLIGNKNRCHFSSITSNFYLTLDLSNYYDIVFVAHHNCWKLHCQSYCIYAWTTRSRFTNVFAAYMWNPPRKWNRRLLCVKMSMSYENVLWTRLFSQTDFINVLEDYKRPRIL